MITRLIPEKCTTPIMEKVCNYSKDTFTDDYSLSFSLIGMPVNYILNTNNQLWFKQFVKWK